MTENAFTTVTRGAASVMTRRGSLRPLAGALAATVAAPSLVRAKQRGKKNRNGNNRCKRQAAGCRRVVRELCDPEEDDVCQAVLACCPPLGACNATAFFACVDAID